MNENRVKAHTLIVELARSAKDLTERYAHEGENGPHALFYRIVGELAQVLDDEMSEHAPRSEIDAAAAS